MILALVLAFDETGLWRAKGWPRIYSSIGTEFARRFCGDKPLLFAFRWRHHVHSTPVRPLCNICKMGVKLWKWYIFGPMAQVPP